MYMPAAERESPISTARAAEQRSPFVRLTDLLAGTQPGKPVINLAVGEPQHPVPPFVGPGPAAAPCRIRPLSREQGHRAISAARCRNGFRGAMRCRARSMSEHEIIVLNGTREGLFLGAHRGAPLCAADAKANPRSSFPIRFTPLMPPAPTRPTANAVYLPATAKTQFPSRPRCAFRRSARAHGGVLSRLALQSAGRGGGRRVSRAPRVARAPPRLPHLRRRMLFGNLFDAEAGRHA